MKEEEEGKEGEGWVGVLNGGESPVKRHKGGGSGPSDLQRGLVSSAL